MNSVIYSLQIFLIVLRRMLILFAVNILLLLQLGLMRNSMTFWIEEKSSFAYLEFSKTFL